MTSFRTPPAPAIRTALVAWLPLLATLGHGPARAQTETVGRWSPAFDTKNVMIHASVLPNGKVLFWGRREVEPQDEMKGDTLDQHFCVPRIWDPANPGSITETPRLDYNAFCAGHAFLPDGRLFVAGGHRFDFKGSRRAYIYDHEANTWTRLPDMNGGRWYPTVVALPDGGVLVSFGANENGTLNTTQQIWKDDAWRDTVGFNGPPLYPRMHVIKDGRVFMSGPFPLTQFLSTQGAGSWSFLKPGDVGGSSRVNGERQYAPAVLYDEGKIVYIGGGLGENGGPTNAVETIDLHAADPAWKPANPMQFRRRQHNATLLPDGTVLVTGGTQGDGFNNTTPGQPIRSAELWDPKSGQWRTLARAGKDRLYHSIAVLLPDATVLSAGGGEYRPNGAVNLPNPPQDTHRNAQVFSPPYLFRAGGTLAERPVITKAPAAVKYGDVFDVETPRPADVGQVNWVRLSSVTHSWNMDQRINFLKFTPGGGGLRVTAPADAGLCPPGHYMLFMIDKNNVPSVARIVRINP